MLFYVLFAWNNETTEGESHIATGRSDCILAAIVKSIKDKRK